MDKTKKAIDDEMKKRNPEINKRMLADGDEV